MPSIRLSSPDTALGRFAAILSLVLWIIGAILPSNAALSAEKPRGPNIVVILADDLGYGDVGCYGGRIATPVLDRLAADGMRFTDAHSGSAVCSPTRYGLVTGRYAWRTKLQRGVLGGLSPRLIEPGRMTIASLLKSQGYATACVGKWHLGMDWVVKPGKEISELSIETPEQAFNVDHSQPITNGPTSVGFDEYFGISASLDMVPYTFIHNDRVTVNPTESRNFLMMLGHSDDRSTRLGPAAPGFEAEDVLPTLIRHAGEWIDGRAADARDGKPFFLYLPLASPHTPIYPSPEWRGKSGMNPYADFVMQNDAAIGEVLTALERNGLTQSTLVIVTSDNGCSPQAKIDELEQHQHFPSGPLRGHKADLFEGGHRIPFIARWPGHVAAGSRSDALICLTDVLATAAEIIGQSVPPEAAEDSISILPILKGEPGRREHLVSHSVNGSFAIRRGDWKLLLCPDSGGWSAPRPGTKAAQGLPPRQLYNLRADLKEQTNLVDQQPEQAASLLALLEEFVANGRSTPGPKQSNAVPVVIEKQP